MRNPIQRFAEAAEMLARRAQAGAALCFAIIFLLGGMWLTVAFGIDWFTMAADVLLLVFARRAFVYACETYGSIKPRSQRSEGRQRYFHSQSLYIPGSMDEARRRRKSQYK